MSKGLSVMIHCVRRCGVWRCCVRACCGRVCGVTVCIARVGDVWMWHDMTWCEWVCLTVLDNPSHHGSPYC